MKKVSAILAMVVGGLVCAICLLGITTNLIIEPGYYDIPVYNGWYYNYVEIPAPLPAGYVIILVALMAVAICMIVFAALMLRSGRQKAASIVVLVMACVLISPVIIILLWVYLVQSGKVNEKSKVENFSEKIKFLRKIKEENLMTDKDYKEALLKEIEKL